MPKPSVTITLRNNTIGQKYYRREIFPAEKYGLWQADLGDTKDGSQKMEPADRTSVLYFIVLYRNVEISRPRECTASCL